LKLSVRGANFTSANGKEQPLSYSVCAAMFV
jgi:hypothetical protein